MNKKIIYLIIVIIVAILVGGSLYFLVPQKEKKLDNKDGEKFSSEYKELSKDNIYTYRKYEEIEKILEHGTGLVYLGFPECPWCQRYVVYLNEVAKEQGVEKIYYYNIMEDRKNNTKEYQKLVSILEENLSYDEEGNSRIYAPSIIAVKNGKIVGFDDETAKDTKGCKTPDEYWTKEEIKDLKSKLKKMINKIGTNTCTDCNK